MSSSHLRGAPGVGHQPAVDHVRQVALEARIASRPVRPRDRSTALSSSQDVRATRDLANLTREDQAAREQPVVVVHHAGFQMARDDKSPSGYGLAAQVRNVGLGPALEVRLSARQTGEPIFMEFRVVRLADARTKREHLRDDPREGV